MEIQLLCIAHLVEEKIISGIEGALGDGMHPRPYRRRNGLIWPYYVFCKNLGKRHNFG